MLAPTWATLLSLLSYHLQDPKPLSTMNRLLIPDRDDGRREDDKATCPYNADGRNYQNNSYTHISGRTIIFLQLLLPVPSYYSVFKTPTSTYRHESAPSLCYTYQNLIMHHGFKIVLSCLKWVAINPILFPFIFGVCFSSQK